MKTTEDVKAAVSLLVAGATLSPEDAATVRLYLPRINAALDACAGVPTELCLPRALDEAASTLYVRACLVKGLETELASARSALSSIEAQRDGARREVARLRAVCGQAERAFSVLSGTRPSAEADALAALRAAVAEGAAVPEPADMAVEMEEQWHRAKREIGRLRAVAAQAERVLSMRPDFKFSDIPNALAALRAVLSGGEQVAGPEAGDPDLEAAQDALEVAARDLAVAHDVMRQALPIIDAHRRNSGGEGDIAAASIRALLARKDGK